MHLQQQQHLLGRRRAGAATVAASSSSWPLIGGTGSGCHRRPRLAATATTASSSAAPPSLTSHETDVVVIGSGIGGLSCAALLSKVYGLDVTVLEAHYRPGGAAHSFTRNGYDFEAGPSLYNGMAGRGPGANPLALVLQAIGEGDLPLIRYNQWRVHLPEGTFDTGVGSAQFREMLVGLRGESAGKEWDAMRAFMPPLARAATSLPPLALRSDWGALRTAGVRYAGRLFGWEGGDEDDASSSSSSSLQLPPIARLGALTQPFSLAVLDRVPISDPFLRNWYDLLCFLLSGLDSKGTIAAEVAFMDALWYGGGGGGDAALEFPVGGSGALVAALQRGLERGGGRLHLNAPVERVIVQNGRAVGVRVKARGGSTNTSPLEIRARRAVVSSASVWDTMPLLPAGSVPEAWRRARMETPPCPSFMHLHLGFDATGLDPFPMHHLSVRHWDQSQGGVMAEQNVVLVSVPTVEDATLRPRHPSTGEIKANHHALHAYTPATEPWSGLWDQVEPGTEAYERLKEERAGVLWEAAAKAVLGGDGGASDVAELKRRAEATLIGTPHTHKKYLRRAFGSYGPAIRAGEATFEFGGSTPLPGLLMASDSVFPGIGLPAVAAAGAIAANTLVSVEEHEGKLLSGALGI